MRPQAEPARLDPVVTDLGSEMRRILSLPAMARPRTSIPPRTAAIADRLLPIQREMLAEAESAPAPIGVVGEIGAGYGKTIPSFLLPYVWDVPSKDALLIVPPDLYDKTLRDLAKWGPVFPEAVDHLPQVLSAGKLSHPKNATILHELRPDVIVIDEAHIFAGVVSARTQRLLDYVVAYPNTRIAMLSGTLNKKEIRRVAHLMETALREWCFLPTKDAVLDKWASVLDFGARPGREAIEYMQPLVRWANQHRLIGDYGRKAAAGMFTRAARAGSDPEPDLARFRHALRARRTTCPGVVTTPDTDVGTALHLHRWRWQPSEAIVNALAALRDEWILPNNEELVDALDYHRHAFTISNGFYYEIEYKEPQEVVDLWLDRRRKWGRALRRQLLYIPGYRDLDSPARIHQAALQDRAHPDTNRALADWLAVKDTVRPIRHTRWIDRSTIDMAASRLANIGRGIVWFQSRAVGEALAEHMPVFGGGSDQPPDSIDRCACSINAHGTGKHLVSWTHHLVLEPPRDPDAMEQLLARSHREGQEADVVTVDLAQHTWLLRARLHATVKESRHLADTGVQRPRLLHATWI